MVTLTSDEVQRYKRHLVLRDVGAPGQQKLKAARVLIIGAGGLGSPVLTYLAAAGVGTIGIIDDDRVSIDNLQRQIAHRTEDAEDLKSTARGTRFKESIHTSTSRRIRSVSTRKTRWRSSRGTISLRTARTISRRAISYPTPAILRSGRSPTRRLGRSTATFLC